MLTIKNVSCQITYYILYSYRSLKHTNCIFQFILLSFSHRFFFIQTTLQHLLIILSARSNILLKEIE